MKARDCGITGLKGIVGAGLTIDIYPFLLRYLTEESFQNLVRHGRSQ